MENGTIEVGNGAQSSSGPSFPVWSRGAFRIARAMIVEGDCGKRKSAGAVDSSALVLSLHVRRHQCG